MALLTPIPVTSSLFLCKNGPQSPRIYRKRLPFSPLASLQSSSSSSSSSSHESPSFAQNKVESAKLPSSEKGSNYALAEPNGGPVMRFVQSTESNIEKVIFDFRFLALLAIGGSLAGSVLCFLNGCIYIFEAYKVYWTSCVKGIHTGNMVLRLVEAIGVGVLHFCYGQLTVRYFDFFYQASKKSGFNMEAVTSSQT